jgi:hypothetical protein
VRDRLDIIFCVAILIDEVGVQVRGWLELPLVAPTRTRILCPTDKSLSTASNK